MDVVTVDNDVLSLEATFKGWLQDCGTDVEHLHIVLPSPLTQMEGGDEVVIKCDLHERVLSPLSLTSDHFVSMQWHKKCYGAAHRFVSDRNLCVILSYLMRFCVISFLISLRYCRPHPLHLLGVRKGVSPPLPPPPSPCTDSGPLPW